MGSNICAWCGSQCPIFFQLHCMYIVTINSNGVMLTVLEHDAMDWVDTVKCSGALVLATTVYSVTYSPLAYQMQV